MNRTQVLLIVTLIAAPLVLGAGELKSAEAPKPEAPIDEAVEARSAVSIAWSALDAQQKALNFLNSHQAHRRAIVALNQCQSCHTAASGSTPQHAALAALQPQGPWVGVSVGPADGVLRSQLRLPEGTGVVVTQVVPGSPAQQAGVEEHDILLSVNGKPVAASEDLDRIIQSKSADTGPLTLKLIKSGETVEKQVTPQQQSYVTWLNTVGLVATAPAYRIGVNVSDPDPTLRKQLKLGDSGVVVDEVQAGKPAEAAGVKAGDVLLSVDGKPLTHQEMLAEEIRNGAEKVVELELMRGGVTLRISVKPVKEESGNNAALEAYVSGLTLSDEARELMLVHPRSVQVLADDLKPNAPTPTGERLRQITEQLEQLRQTVESLRADLERPAESPK